MFCRVFYIRVPVVSFITVV